MSVASVSPLRCNLKCKKPQNRSSETTSGTIPGLGSKRLKISLLSQLLAHFQAWAQKASNLTFWVHFWHISRLWTRNELRVASEGLFWYFLCLASEMAPEGLFRGFLGLGPQMCPECPRRPSLSLFGPWARTVLRVAPEGPV